MNLRDICYIKLTRISECGEGGQDEMLTRQYTNVLIEG